MLDINTNKGQGFLKWERYLTEKVKNKFNINIIETDKRREARIDNLLIKDCNLVAVAEMKCRNLSQIELQRLGDTWLVTNQKIKDGCELSRLLCVPFLGFLYLIPDDIILMWKISDSSGNLLFNFEVKNTETQATCNGGKIYRDNAYLPRKYAKLIV